MPSPKSTPLTSITLILSPYHVGHPSTGPGLGPSFLLSHNLLLALQSLGIPVHTASIPASAISSAEGEIGRTFTLLRETSVFVSAARGSGSFPLVLAGNCCASVGVAAGVLLADSSSGKDFDDEREGKEAAELGCVWFDAHDDYNTPDTLMSGYLDSMGVAMLAGECWKSLLGTVPGFRPMDLKRVVHVGMRDVTDAERQRVVDSGMDLVWGNSGKRVDFAGEFGVVLERKRLGRTFVHVDLDCLDVSLGQVNKFAAPGGLLGDDLGACLERVANLTVPASLTVASFDPSYDGADNIARIAVQAVKGFVEALIAKGVVTAQSEA